MSSIYTVYDESTKRTLLDDFISKHKNLFKSEIMDIVSRLEIMGHDTGAREQYFKLAEGAGGDLVCALYDRPEKSLRLYCIRYGSVLLIVGDGAEKPKSIRALQESAELRKANYFLKDLSILIKERTDNKEIKFSNEGMDLIGNLEFNTNEDE